MVNIDSIIPFALVSIDIPTSIKLSVVNNCLLKIKIKNIVE